MNDKDTVAADAADHIPDATKMVPAGHIADARKLVAQPDERAAFEAHWCRDVPSMYRAAALAEIKANRDGERYKRDEIQWAWEAWQARATAPQASALSKDAIREVFMAHGFTIKEGQTDLKQYVYDAAYALLGRAAVPQTTLQDAAAEVVQAIAATKQLSDLVEAQAAVKGDAPFANCSFRHCDLPGQCKAEGACHHPARAAVPQAGAPYLPCPICKGVEGCDHTVPERARAAGATLTDEQLRTIEHAATKLENIGHIFAGDKESRRLAVELKALLPTQQDNSPCPS